jgi:hypothetical protein
VPTLTRVLPPFTTVAIPAMVGTGPFAGTGAWVSCTMPMMDPLRAVTFVMKSVMV